MHSHIKYQNSSLPRIKNILIISRRPKFKKNDSEYSLLEEIYNALFYSVLEHIHQPRMLSHVKYRNSKFTQIERNLKII